MKLYTRYASFENPLTLYLRVLLHAKGRNSGRVLARAGYVLLPRLPGEQKEPCN